MESMTKLHQCLYPNEDALPARRRVLWRKWITSGWWKWYNITANVCPLTVALMAEGYHFGLAGVVLRQLKYLIIWISRTCFFNCLSSVVINKLKRDIFISRSQIRRDNVPPLHQNSFGWVSVQVYACQYVPLKISPSAMIFIISIFFLKQHPINVIMKVALHQRQKKYKFNVYLLTYMNKLHVKVSM